jgi:tetratricopeptide (TPR) repeat protein
MLRLNSLIVGLLISSCLSTTAKAATINTNSNKELEHTLLTQSTQAGRQQETFARDANTLYLQIHGAEILRQQAEFDRQQAEIARQKQIQQWRDSIPELESKRDYLALSKVFSLLGELRESLYAAEKAVAANPNSAEARYRGNGRNKANDVQGALADYSRAIELDPNRFVSYHNRGIIKKRFDRSGAIQDFRMAIKVAKVDPNVSYIIDRSIREDLQELKSLGVTE